MGSRRPGRVRVARGALILTAAAGLVLGSGALRAHADDLNGSGSSADCMTGWNSDGTVAAVGEGLLLPYENLVGEPYAEALIDDTPHAKSLASMAYEGFVGEVILGTSVKGLGPDNPTTAKGFYPPPSSGGFGSVHDAHDYGPLGHTEAYDRPDKSYADARTGFVAGGEQLSVGPSFAHSETIVTPTALTGINRAATYDIKLGSLHIALATTDLTWKDDGTTDGTLATWKMELHGVDVDGKTISSSNGDGFTFQGQSPQPGPAAHRQTNEQFKQFTDALEKGGAGHYTVKLNDGTFSAGGGSIDIDEVGMLLSSTPDPLTKGGSVRGVNVQLARLINHTSVQRGPCDAVRQMPEWTDRIPPSGPNLPPYPPPKSGQHPVTNAGSLLPALPAPASGVVATSAPSLPTSAETGRAPAGAPRVLDNVLDLIRSGGALAPPAAAPRG